MKLDRAEHAPERGFEKGADTGAGDALVAQGLEEQQGIHDAVARKRVDHEPLLVGGDHFLARSVDVENALIEELHVLNERNLVLQARVGDDALRLAEFEHQRLLGLAHGEQREVGDERGDAEDNRKDREGAAVHGCVSCGSAWEGLVVNSESGRNGTTPGPALSSTITLSASPSTFSMVSMKMRWRVTSGAFLYCS